MTPSGPLDLLRFVADLGGRTSLLSIILAEMDVASVVDAVKLDWVSYQEDSASPTIAITPKGWEVLEHPVATPPV